MGFGFRTGFGLFGVIFSITFLLVIVVFVVILVKGISQWNRNNHSPRLTVPATVISKRADVSHHRHANAGDVTGAHGYHTNISTAYYVTFQVESGDRMELQMTGNEYGVLIEGDRGNLTFQGTRYLGFERI